jgi:type II secretory pathway component PulF
MPVFVYTALDRQGRQTTGTLPAENRIAAYDDLSSKGLAPIAVDEQAGTRAAQVADPNVSPTTRVSAASLESFTRELANLLAAGLPLSRALHLLRREASQPTARKIWGLVHDDVVGGTALADALAKWPRIFSTVYVAMVRAGEAGGFLHVVLQQIADFRVREQDLKGRVKAALIYPCILGVLACAVLVFLLTFFIPKFSTIFAQFGGKLPWLTQMIVAASQVLMKYGPLLLVALVIGIVALKRALGTESGKRMLERIILKSPAIGKVTARFALVRFCRMLGTLVGAGVPLVAALRVAREALGNQTLADAVSYAIEEVQRGTPLSRSLAATPILFPASVVEMVAIAEETGRLDKELQRLSVSYEAELDRNLRMLVSLAEPAMLFVTAIVIGTVVVGMLLPILTLQDIVH